MRRYRSLNDYLKDTFGEKVYKLALDGGMTCPNRDGTKGTGGCIFCSEGGSGDFAERYTGNIETQITDAISRISGKTKAEKFIAYFQSYTNTYAPRPYLEKLFCTAVEDERIAALSIGTRPDCLPPDVVELLEELNKIKPVFVELGLQTSNEATGKLIRRGYPLCVYDEAVYKLKGICVNVVTHMIIGLPHETTEDMKNTARHIAEVHSDGIKLQLLHVLRGTALEKMYLENEFKTLTLDEYVDILCEILPILPPQTVIHRLTGDAPKSLLVSPLWSADKKNVLNTINRAFADRNVFEGSAYENTAAKP